MPALGFPLLPPGGALNSLRLPLASIAAAPWSWAMPAAVASRPGDRPGATLASGSVARITLGIARFLMMGACGGARQVRGASRRGFLQG